MQKFYFTYGPSETMPYHGGWTEIEAPNEDIARHMFKAIHPAEDYNMPLRCAFVYSEEHWKTTTMSIRGNLGEFCHERISYTIVDQT